jgi:hypothetical protein
VAGRLGDSWGSAVHQAEVPRGSARIGQRGDRNHPRRIPRWTVARLTLSSALPHGASGVAFSLDVQFTTLLIGPATVLIGILFAAISGVALARFLLRTWPPDVSEMARCGCTRWQFGFAVPATVVLLAALAFPAWELQTGGGRLAEDASSETTRVLLLASVVVSASWIGMVAAGLRISRPLRSLPVGFCSSGDTWKSAVERMALAASAVVPLRIRAGLPFPGDGIDQRDTGSRKPITQSPCFVPISQCPPGVITIHCGPFGSSWYVMGPACRAAGIGMR